MRPDNLYAGQTGQFAFAGNFPHFVHTIPMTPVSLPAPNSQISELFLRSFAIFKERTPPYPPFLVKL